MHAAGAAEAGTTYHLHAYLLWTDGVSVHLRDIAPFYFQTVRPRIDICKGRVGTTMPGSPALHGLWYVAVVKDGTLKADTNYPAGIWYKPLAGWLQNLFQDNKMCFDKYIEHSAAHFRIGSSSSTQSTH